jgi:uncharacterized protein DUF2154/cell wall-active antibiotic response 4TMS protein YvqF
MPENVPENVRHERPPLVFPIVLIIVGALFLYANYRPGFDAWYVLRTYWPLILIFVGLAKIFDSARARRSGATGTDAGSIGPTIAAVAFLVVVFVLIFHSHAFTHGGRFSSRIQHESQHVDLQGANSMDASIQSPAGLLTIGGGSSRALEAEFNFAESYGAPVVDYHVASGIGQINVTQDHDSPHFGISHNDWNLRFNDSIPLELKVEMGAGEGRLHLRDIPVTRLTLNMGAGRVMVDLSGDRKKDVDADIEGGVGEATVRLPRNVGVIAHAEGGIGGISAPDFRKQDSEYTNDAYGKAPATIHLKVSGGVGTIKLQME